jgi:hypothetical protein
VEAGSGVGVGMMAISTSLPLMEATVRLMPSMVMEPCGTTQRVRDSGITEIARWVR